MAKIYFTNHGLELARAKVFSSLGAGNTVPILDAFEISSGDYLPKSSMIIGTYRVYGGGGLTNSTHSAHNINYKTVGIGRVGARCGCAFVINANSWVTDNALYVSKFKKEYDCDFLAHYLNFLNLNQYANQSAQPVISQRGISRCTVPIVDISEQRKIAKILTAIENGDDFKDEYNLKSILSIEQKISRLKSEIENQTNYLQLLRQSILQDAVQGKLVSQDPKDEPASELLKRIKAEKEKLIKAGKLKKEKPLPPISEDEIPFELPKGWVWCRLGEIGRVTGGGTPSMGKPEYWNGDIPWISPKDMWTDTVVDSEMKVTPKGIAESSASLIPVGSLLIVGRSGILKRKLPVAINQVECTVNQDMKVIIPYVQAMNRFLQLLLLGMENIVLKHFVKFGMTVHSLKYKEFELMPIPIPTFDEQTRIVRKVEHLLRSFENLENQINQSKRDTEMLLQAVLREAFV